MEQILGLLHNQFVGGGLLLMLTGGVLAMLRQVPLNIWYFIKRQLVVQVEVLNSDPLFDYFTVWLHEQPYSRRSRRLTATTFTRINSEIDEDAVPSTTARRPKLQVFLSPAPGTHIFVYRQRLLWLVRAREDHGANSGTDNQKFSLMKPETYTITMMGRHQQIIRQLIEDVVEFSTNKDDGIRIYTVQYGGWSIASYARPRNLSTVILPQGQKESILEDLKGFMASADWYRNVGIPWHRGYLFYGVPGCGKTSLVSALAGELRADLYVLNLGTHGMDDNRLMSLMSGVRPGAIVLMEDIDCTAPERETEKEGVTLSGLLNCLDGVQSVEGSMVFMTTNYPDRLDPALIRPGRIDMQLEFKHPNDEQIIHLHQHLLPGVALPTNLTDLRLLTMAELQQKFLLQTELYGSRN